MAVQRRNTKQRKLVLDAVRRSFNHPTADEIYNAVREQDDKISRGTVYRNLNLLADAGEILSIKTPGGQSLRPHHRAACTCHLHFVQPCHRRAVAVRHPAQRPSKRGNRLAHHLALHHLRGSLPRLPVDVWDMP